MFGFGSTHRDPFADIKSAERWFASFPETDPLALHGALMAELGLINEHATRRTPARLDTLFFADGRAGALRKLLTSQYIEHASRSSKIENQLWSALFDLTQAFLLAYQSFASEVHEHSQSAKWQLLLPGLVARQIIHLRQDAKIRFFRYEQWIPAKWGNCIRCLRWRARANSTASRS